jgi:glycosyltransferase involved in cell wall biosynthesis
LDKPWNITFDANFKPKVTVILPTYDEADIIEQRLENLQQQDYPKELMEVLIVDSSDDETASIVKKWVRRENDMNLKLIREAERRGKIHALELALKYISPDCEVIVFTDADVFWHPEALSKVVSYLSDHSVGASTASIVYTDIENSFLEDAYRDYYNIIRVAESKVHSTPIHNGPLLAIKAELLRSAGLPTFPGSDDSAFGSFVAFNGYRAVQADDIIIKEPIRGNQVLRKIRRAQHLLINFLTTKRYAKKRGLYRKSLFDRIWRMEWYFHVVNPWLLMVSIAFFLIDVTLFKSLISMVLLSIGLAFLALKTFRMWFLQQLYLTVAAIRNLWTKDVMWKKPERGRKIYSKRST